MVDPSRPTVPRVDIRMSSGRSRSARSPSTIAWWCHPTAAATAACWAPTARVRAARRAVAGQAGRRHALARRRAELRAQPAAARIRADRRGRARARAIFRDPALPGAHGRAGGPGPRRWRPALRADGAAGRHADRSVGHPVELRRPSRSLTRSTSTRCGGWYGSTASRPPSRIDAGVDAIEIHANHDDVVQWFLSPLTNRRDDEYGGTVEQRRRFLREVVEAIRVARRRPDHARPAALPRRDDRGRLRRRGLRGRRGRLHGRGHGRLLQPRRRQQLGRSELHPASAGTTTTSGRRCAARSSRPPTCPVVYAGRVRRRRPGRGRCSPPGTPTSSPWRGPRWPIPSSSPRPGPAPRSECGPCIGLNECIHRKLVDGLVYACGVNPRFAREAEPPHRRPPAVRRSVLVVGGGPAGHRARGAVRRARPRRRAVGAQAAPRRSAGGRRARPGQPPLPGLDRLPGASPRTASGVHVVLGREATVDDVLAAARRRRGGRHRRHATHDPTSPATGPAPRRDDLRGADAARSRSGRTSSSSPRTTDLRPCPSPTTSPASAIRSRSSTRAPASPRWSASTRPARCSPA